MAGTSPEWLPPGFTVKIKQKKGRKIKYYVNDATGEEYHSKKEVIHCATEDNSLLVTPQSEKGDGNGPSSINKVDVISDKTNDSAPWLPNGWTVEEKRRKSGPAQGSAYKIYIDPSSGNKFYSKPAVTRYLNTIDHADTMTTQNKIDNVDELVPEKSPQVIYMANTGDDHGQKRKGKSPVKIDSVDELVPEKSPQLISMANTGGDHGQKRKGKSRAKIDSVDEPVPEKLTQVISMANTGGNRGQKRKGKSRVKIDTVVEPSPDMSPQVISTTNTSGIHEKKKNGGSFVTVSIERTTADGLPSGWTKEVRISQSGNRIRKDPFYTDPVSAYIFCSKLDALRYLKTNDIRSCMSKPLKKELDEVKLIENKIPVQSSDPANEKLSMHNNQLSLGEESNGGEEVSGTKSPAEPETKLLKQKQVTRNSVKITAVGAVSLEQKVSCENSNKNVEMGKNPEPENYISKKDVRVMAVDVAISSPVTDPSTKQQLPESGGRNMVGSRKSKRRDSSLPLRSSKRLAGSEPEIQSTLNLSERTLRAALKVITASEVDAYPSFPHEASDSIPEASNIEPAKKAADDAVIVEETPQDDNQLKVEKPPTESSAIPEEPSVENASEKPLDDGQRSQESQLCYDFGDSWSDPLEFALKTLRGELPIEDNLTFPSSFGEQLNTSFNQIDGCLKQSQFTAPINFQSEFASHSESSKKHNAVDPLPASSPLFSPLQNAVNPLPASSPSFSSLGNIGFSSWGGFNFQPNTEVGKKDSKTKFNP